MTIWKHNVLRENGIVVEYSSPPSTQQVHGDHQVPIDTHPIYEHLVYSLSALVIQGVFLNVVRLSVTYITLFRPIKFSYFPNSFKCRISTLRKDGLDSKTQLQDKIIGTRNRTTPLPRRGKWPTYLRMLSAFI